MKDEDLKFKFGELPLTSYFDEDPSIMKNYLHSKFGDTVMVEEWFEYEGDEEYSNDAALPPESTFYSEYQSQPGTYHPGDYNNPPEYPDPVEWYYVYDVKINDLFRHLELEYDFFEAGDFEGFFKAYVYTPEQRKKYFENARKYNEKGNLHRHNNYYYSNEYKDIK